MQVARRSIITTIVLQIAMQKATAKHIARQGAPISSQLVMGLLIIIPLGITLKNVSNIKKEIHKTYLRYMRKTQKTTFPLNLKINRERVISRKLYSGCGVHFACKFAL